MSKSRKSRKQKMKKAPRFSAKVMLTPRLESLLHDPDLPQKSPERILAALDDVAAGVDSAQMSRTLLAMVVKAPDQNRDFLAQHLPEWLRARDLIPTLRKLVTDGTFTDDKEKSALDWLQAVGIDTQALVVSRPDMFHSAYIVEDESQAALILLCHTSPRRARVHGFTFLLDHNPPWDGAVKDVMDLPQRPPKKAQQQFVDRWKDRPGPPPMPIDAPQAKSRIAEAMLCNRDSGIRLPRDLVVVRDKFERVVFALPDGPGQPAFSMADFDQLARSGETAESIMHYERTVGRRIRTEDGSEVLLMGAPWDLDEEWDEL